MILLCDVFGPYTLVSGFRTENPQPIPKALETHRSPTISKFCNSFFHTAIMRIVLLWFWYATLALGALATPQYQIAQSCCPGCSYGSSCCCAPPKTVTVVKTKTVPKLAKTTVKTQQKRLLERQTIPHHLCPTCPKGAVLLKSPKPGVKYCCAAKRQTVTTTRYVTKTSAIFSTYKPSSSVKPSSSSVKISSSAKSSSSMRASSTLRSSTTSTESTSSSTSSSQSTSSSTSSSQSTSSSTSSSQSTSSSTSTTSSMTSQSTSSSTSTSQSTSSSTSTTSSTTSQSTSSSTSAVQSTSSSTSTTSSMTSQSTSSSTSTTVAALGPIVCTQTGVNFKCSTTGVASSEFTDISDAVGECQDYCKSYSSIADGPYLFVNAYSRFDPDLDPTFTVALVIQRHRAHKSLKHLVSYTPVRTKNELFVPVWTRRLNLGSTSC